MKRKIRMGMVGGGQGAFIGAVHRIAAAMDGQVELVCGAFSREPETSVSSGLELFLPEERCYPNFTTMMSAERDLPAGERMDFVAIVTPNSTHYPIAKSAMESGFHVMSDKPATFTLEEALQLRKLVLDTGLLYGLTHTYSGYPLVKEARERIARGELGPIRKVIVEYLQGWLSDKESEGIKQAEWRLDPARAGASCCMGDIGVHAAHLAEYMCGVHIEQICADLNSTVSGRVLDDDGSVLLRFSNGARGVLMASQIAVGEENALRIRVYGEKGGLEWDQQEPNTLIMKSNDGPSQILRAAGGYLGSTAQANTRTPAGHPEGYLEAFANIYRNFAEQLSARINNTAADPSAMDIPGIEDAVRGMAFIEQVVDASKEDAKWKVLTSF